MNEEIVTSHFIDIEYLKGDFSVDVFKHDEGNEWKKCGKGFSNYSIENMSIRERIEVVKENKNIIIINTICFNSDDNTYTMLTLDTTFGLIDTYKGTFKNEKLELNNLDSGIERKNKKGISYSFKLIFKKISFVQHEILIGYTKDSGKTWLPFVKNVYTKK
ncbi:hypothetical protein [Lutibacter sp. Hel_I_33_5]|uniref:hypothetical protein n=1 Tax=Lutibacter sp. Hel_I_33_5 TaxID=1566289 RepID=UPI001C97C676|nr:hypothetical protein [Lutibacter sp. Hel_I_33_5]